MAKRPPYSERSFLAAVFSPKKNPVPTGLRKSKLVSVKGRSARRLARYNSMPALNQQVLAKSGQREAYLRGDVTLADAKRALRNTAVDLGVAKPLRPKVAPIQPGKGVDVRSRVLDHLNATLNGADTRKPVNLGTLRRGSLMMTPEQLRRALKMTAPDIKEAGQRGSDDETEFHGKPYNPFWYH